MMERVAPMGDQSSSLTNLSRLFSLTIFDENGTDVQINTTLSDPIEFFIPRDPNLSISPMFIQNVTEINDGRIFFNYHLVNLTQTNPNLTYSLHLEFSPFNSTLSYFLIYRFNHPPQYDPKENYTLFCSSGKCEHGK